MKTNTKKILVTFFFFILAGLLEIGGGYLIWLWLRDNYSWTIGILGGLVLFMYGIIPTFHKFHFKRVYAGYGGVKFNQDIFIKPLQY